MTTQLINSNGNAAANQFVITEANKTTFKSYNTKIAEQHNSGKIVLDVKALNYSLTTSKHLFIFLGMNREEIERDIKSGVIVLVDLNR